MAIRKKTKKKKVRTKAADRSTGYWVLVLNPDEWVRKYYHPQAIFDVLWQKKYWGLKGTSDGVKSIQKGDVVLFYPLFSLRDRESPEIIRDLKQVFHKW